MIFNTHDRTPKPKNKLLNILFIIIAVVIVSFFVFLEIIISIYSDIRFGSIYFAIFSVVFAWFILTPFWDLTHSYIKVEKDSILVVNYFFGIKRKEMIPIKDIKYAKVLSGHSPMVRGHRIRFLQYIVFRDCNGNYLFKLAFYPETKQFFEKFVKIS